MPPLETDASSHSPDPAASGNLSRQVWLHTNLPDAAIRYAQSAPDTLDLDSNHLYGTNPGPSRLTDLGAQTPASNVDSSTHNVDQRSLVSPGSEYRGEGIKQNLPPTMASVDKDDETHKIPTLKEFSSQNLGDQNNPDADRYAREVQRLNNLANADGLTEGQELMLPGHKRDGSLIVAENDGRESTISPNGRASVKFKDGATIVFMPLKNGGYTESATDAAHHSAIHTRTSDGHGGYNETARGATAADNYKIHHTADGKYLVERNGHVTDKTTYDPAHPDAAVERARLCDSADRAIADPMERLKFYEDLERFKMRATQKNISSEEQANFYHEAGRLLDDKGTAHDGLPNATDRARIAEQLMMHAASPATIDQGGHDTCGAAALETRMITTNPSTVAHFVADVALTGQFQTAFGNATIDQSLLAPDAESRRVVPLDGERSYASQLFQNGAIALQVPGFKIEKSAHPGDTGERQLDESGNVIEFRGLKPKEIQAMSSKIAGDKVHVTIIENNNINADDGCIHVASEAELRTQLKSLKREKKLPAIMLVDSRNEPFWTDSRAGLAGGSGGGHYINVSDFDERTGKVSIDNQWGARTDHTDIPVRGLYISTDDSFTRDQIIDLAQAVKQNRAEHKVDLTLELQLLRELQSAGAINDTTYEREFTRIALDAERAKRVPGADQDESSRVSWAVYMMEKKLPKEAHDRVEEKLNALSEQLYKQQQQHSTHRNK